MPFSPPVPATKGAATGVPEVCGNDHLRSEVEAPQMATPTAHVTTAPKAFATSAGSDEYKKPTGLSPTQQKSTPSIAPPPEFPETSKSPAQPGFNWAKNLQVLLRSEWNGMSEEQKWV